MEKKKELKKQTATTLLVRQGQSLPLFTNPGHVQTVVVETVNSPLWQKMSGRFFPYSVLRFTYFSLNNH